MQCKDLNRKKNGKMTTTNKVVSNNLLCVCVRSTLPAEARVFPQLGADFVGLLDHQGELHGVPLWRHFDPKTQRHVTNSIRDASE